MINLTQDELVFSQSGSKLDESVRKALDTAAGWVLKAHHFEQIDLEKVTTQTYRHAAFAAFVKLSILRNPGLIFDEQYVSDVFEVVNLPVSGIPEEYFCKVIYVRPGSARKYKAAYGSPVRRGLGAFLVALHASGAITLPCTFRWPSTTYIDIDGRKRRGELCDIQALPEILRFIRSLESQSRTQQEDVFNDLNLGQRERLSYIGTRLLLATGWLNPSDANYDDLLILKNDQEIARFAGGKYQGGIASLIDILERKYKANICLSLVGWKCALEERRQSPDAVEAQSIKSLEAIGNVVDDPKILSEICNLPPSVMSPERIGLLKRLPGVDVDLLKLTKAWSELERAFIRKVQRENYKGILQGLGHLNLYLFAYLPYWYSQHPDCLIQFPSDPSKLVGGIFISNLGLADEVEKPLAFTDFLARTAQIKEWKPQTHYGLLKQVEKFFDFLERNSTESIYCSGFRQPLRPDDYPALTRSTGTSKRPISRRIFSFYLLYVEALIAHTEVLLNRILLGDINDGALNGLGDNATVVDTFAMQDIFGFIPVVFYKGQSIPLRRIPNTIQLERMRLKDGRVIRLPQPHALNHILVVLHTGLRNNHVQWLDGDTFDKDVEEGHREFTRLYVNTDKVKNTGWSPHVDIRVIEVLRNQLRWRNLIGEPGFTQKVHYNNNERSKWGSFYPLFSAAQDGSPHSDSRYLNVWLQLLSGVQAILPTIGEPNLILCRLLPSSVPYRGIDAADKLHEYGANQQRVCLVDIKSDISPHSARVSVASHLISFLPADVIGRYITGQTPETVGHYVVLDDDEVHREQQLQNLALRKKKKGYDEGYDAMISGDKGNERFIKADEVNSRLAQSMRENLDETITAYGFTCLTLNENIKTGLDILRETRCQGAVTNKTEICPYGNHCPQDLAKQLGGARRCGLCHYAVRSIDHLPAVTAKGRQVMEMFSEIELKLDAEDVEVTHTPDEIDLLEAERGRLAEDLTAWQLVEDVLEMTRQRIASGASDKKWVVQKPEIIEQHLKRALFPSRETEYLLARMQESVAYPMLESPQIRARSDILRRQLLANTGRTREAFNPKVPENPAAECLGLIRSVVAANKLSYQDLLEMLETDKHLDAIPHQSPRLLTVEEA